VLGVEHGALEPLGELLAGDDGLLGLLGESVELHVDCSLCVRFGIGLVDGVQELGRSRLRPSRRGSVGRTTRTRTYRSPEPSPLKRGMPWPLSRKVRSFCVPAGTGQQDAALERRDRDLAPEERLASVIGTSRSRSSPRRVKRRWA
jgi:hypothetical protein